MSDNTGIKILRYFTQKLKSFFFSKDILSFLLFLALSAVFWFVHALGKERETTITVSVTYTGIPVDVAISNAPPSEIQLTLKDQGLRLFDYSHHLLPVVIDLKHSFKLDRNNEIHVSSDLLKSKINHCLKLLPTTTIMEVRPDSIVIQYQKLSSRKLSVRLRSSIELARQYMYSDTIRLSPAQVTVYGPIKTLDTMKFAYTELLVKHDLSDTLVTNIKLKPLKLVHYSRPSVNAGIYVEPFTEKKVQMQITSVNCPPNLNIRTFPANVLVTYTVGVSYFNKLTPEDIQIYLDYNDLINNTQARQTLRVKNNSLHISNVRIEPQEVEFILEQN